MERKTYARQALLELIENGLLYSTLENEGITRGQIMNIYKLAHGEYYPFYFSVYILRHFISPLEWFYYCGEELPEKIIFKEKHSAPDSTRFTVGMEILKFISKNRLRREFCEKYKIPLQRFYTISAMYLSASGERMVRAWPKFDVIRPLRKIIHPDYWYIYQDELPKPFVFRLEDYLPAPVLRGKI
jgi:hypothetical protein